MISCGVGLVGWLFRFVGVHQGPMSIVESVDNVVCTWVWRVGETHFTWPGVQPRGYLTVVHVALWVFSMAWPPRTCELSAVRLTVIGTSDFCSVAHIAHG